MSANPDVMMESNEAGVDRVDNNLDYAFLMESTSIEYETERRCNLFRVGRELDEKGYGIVMRQSQLVFYIDYLFFMNNVCLVSITPLVKQNL